MIYERLLQQALLSIREGVVIADATRDDNPIIYVNPAFEEMTGYGADEVMERNCRFLQGSDRDQPELDDLRGALREERPCVVKLRNYRKDGTLFWNELSISPVHDASGRVTHFFGIQKDITKRMVAEMQLQEKQLELESANRRLEELAIRDGLTHVYNRRHFGEQLEKEWKRACREEESLSLLMIDIDVFKQYNDNYGHKAGDDCIQSLADTIQESFQRPADLVARYGGEEFAVLVAEAEEGKVAGRAEALCEKIRQLDIRHSYSPVADCVTVSIGVASTRRPHPLKSPYTLVQTADMALYKAKRGGRNRVVVA